MAIEVREVKRQLLGKWPRGLPHHGELLLFCACVRAGAILRPNLDTTSGEEIPCPDLRPLFMVPQSRSQMFLTFVSPPKDQDADVRFPNSVYGKNESRCRSQQQRSIYSLAFSEGLWYDFEKPKHTQTRRSATTRHRPWRSRCARVKRQLLGK